MKIDEELLYSFGAELKTIKAKEAIFKENEVPIYYFQIVDGTVKENHYDLDGKEFIHNILSCGQSFGDSMLFVEKNYPFNAIALKDCKILKLHKDQFFALLKQYPEVSIHAQSCLSHRLFYNIIMTQNIASQNPETRLKGLMSYLKSFQTNDEQFTFQIHFTRQQIADLTGLRVETVIRAIKKMEQNKVLKIKDRKIFY